MGLFTKLKSKSRSKSKQTAADEAPAIEPEHTIMDLPAAQPKTLSAPPAATSSQPVASQSAAPVSGDAVHNKTPGGDSEDESNDEKDPGKKGSKKGKKDNGVNVRRNILATITLSAVGAGWSV